MKLKRIHIFGASGSGKTFLSKELSKRLKIKSYDLDEIFWKKNGNRKEDVKREEKERKLMLNKIIKKEKWIIEGCYSSGVEDSIKRSDLVVWLNPPFYVLAKRLILRFFKEKLLNQKQGWKDLQLQLKYNKDYHKPNQPAGYYQHKELIEKHKVNFVYIRSKREMKNFLKEFKQR